jgi:23S rRNA pseudouridine1911/1915/1917 synthase
LTLSILHESHGVLAVAKPAGLPTQAPPGFASVESLVRHSRFGTSVAEAVTAGRRRHPGGFLGVPHRLDRSVSGVLLLATTPRAARLLSRQFERRQIVKDYLAIVAIDSTGPLPTADTPADHGFSAGRLTVGGEFEWRDLLRKRADEPVVDVVPIGTRPEPGDREAVTTGRVAAEVDGRLLLELRPLTGRMHQLRVQAAARGLPVLGDPTYGGGEEVPEPIGEAEGARDERSRPIALHAWRITFLDPETAEPVAVECPVPPGGPWKSFALP